LLATLPPRLFFLRLTLRPGSPLLPYTTLFRSSAIAPPSDPTGQAIRGDSSESAPRCPRIARANYPLKAPASLGANMQDRQICWRSEEHTSELQSREKLVCRLLLEEKEERILRV